MPGRGNPMQQAPKHQGARSLRHGVRTGRTSTAGSHQSLKGLDYHAVNLGIFPGATGRQQGPIIISAGRMDRCQGTQRGACGYNARRDHSSEDNDGGGRRKREGDRFERCLKGKTSRTW